MGIWGDGNRSLVEAAIRSRQQDVVDARFRDLTTDSCDCGGALRRRGAMRRRVVVKPEVAARVLKAPLQLALWGSP